MRDSLVRIVPDPVRRLLAIVLGALLVVLAAAPGASAATARHRIDDHDIARVLSKHPGVVPILERGEALALAGRMDEALAAFQEAAEEAPDSALIARRTCQALTVLGRRAEALVSCMRAIKTEGSAMDMRAMVAALMSGDVPPTTGELAQAMRLARRARDTMPQEPWGYAAECDIARRIGDATMLESCLKELQRVAPGHYETTRALAAAAPLGLTWRVWLGWSAIFVLGIGTAAHALWRALRVSPRRPRGAAAAAVVLMAVGIGATAAAPAHAQETPDPSPPAAHGRAAMLSEWPVDDADPESSVPTEERKERNPLQFGYWLMDLTYKAAQATKRGDHEAAVRYYKALVKAVPDRAVSFTRLCESYEATGDWRQAVETCAAALTQPGTTVNDYTHYFSLALAKKGSLTGQEIDTLQKVVSHLREDPVGKDIADDLECQLGVRLEDRTILEQCTAALVANKPDDPRTISFQWALAMARGNIDEARSLVERARASTMKPEGVEQMERGMVTIEQTRRRELYAWGFGGLGVVLAAAGAIVFATRRRATMHPAATAHT